jgi:protein O-mannosyl-transferase
MGPLISLPSGPSSARQRMAVVLLLSLLGAAAFYNSLNVPLLHDDEAAISMNPRVRQLWWSDDSHDVVQSAVTGRPVVLLSLSANYALGELLVPPDSAWQPLASALGIGTGGLSVRGYHLFNVVVHTLSGLLLFGLLWRTLSLPQFGDSRQLTHSVDLATITAAVWLVHPLQVDAVTYVVQRTELLMGLFYLLTLYAALRACRSPHGWLWSVTAVIACASGMLSKESMATAPILVVCYDRIFLFATWRQMWRCRWPLHVGLAACWAPLVAIMLTGPRNQTIGFDLGVTWWQYGGTQLGMLTHYLGLVFWPAELCFDYGRVMPAGTWDQAVGAVVVGALLGATLWALRYHPTFGFAGLFFFFLLAPSSSIVPIVTEVGAERRMHLPLAAVVVLVLLLVDRLLSYGVQGLGTGHDLRVQRLIRCVGAGLVIVALTAVTVQRNEVFGNDLTIWADTVVKAPANCSARNNLGRAYYERGQLEQAHAQFVAAVQLPGCEAQVYGNLGKVLIEMGRLDDAHRYFEDILRDRPEFWRAYEGLGIIYLRRQQWPAAVAAFRRCVNNGYTNADLYTNLGMALFELGEPSMAASYMRAALRLDPEHTVAAENLDYITGLLGGTQLQTR